MKSFRSVASKLFLSVSRARVARGAGIALLAINFLPAGAAHADGRDNKFDEIVAFGESTTDTGNVSGAQCSNSPPFLPAAGFPLFWAPCTPLDPSTHLPAPAYFDDNLDDGFDGRLTNGPVWVEFLADALEVERPRPSDRYGTNYAHAGAKTGPDWVTDIRSEVDPGFNLRVNLYPNNPVCGNYPENLPIEPCDVIRLYQPGEFVDRSEVPHINTQVRQYLHDNRAGFTRKELVLIWGGANDLRDVGGDPDGPESAIANVVTNLVTAVGTVASTGAKHIAVLNQLNAARAPIAQALCGGRPPDVPPDPLCLAQIEAVVTGFNDALRTALRQLQWALREQGSRARVHYVDVYSAGEAAVELSEQFGKPFANTTHPALRPDPMNPPFGIIASDAEDYLFWDVIHPTEKAHRIIAYRVCKTLDRRIRDLDAECGKIFEDD
jgi:phospholipase/lecithinase/hemolysin